MGNATAADVAGWWLAQRQERLQVSEAALAAIRALAPAQTRYALGAAAAEGRPASGWNVILPAAVIDPGFEGA